MGTECHTQGETTLGPPTQLRVVGDIRASSPKGGALGLTSSQSTMTVEIYHLETDTTSVFENAEAESGLVIFHGTLAGFRAGYHGERFDTDVELIGEYLIEGLSKVGNNVIVEGTSDYETPGPVPGSLYRFADFEAVDEYENYYGYVRLELGGVDVDGESVHIYARPEVDLDLLREAEVELVPHPDD